MIPGEVFNKRIADYLKFNREFAKKCPGFETDTHGLVEEVGKDGVRRFYASDIGSKAARVTRAMSARMSWLIEVCRVSQHTTLNAI